MLSYLLQTHQGFNSWKFIVYDGYHRGPTVMGVRKTKLEAELAAFNYCLCILAASSQKEDRYEK